VSAPSRESNVCPTRYHAGGSSLQRLYSTFPNSWPGVGLLLARLTLGTAVIYFGISGFLAHTSLPAQTRDLIATFGGLFLLGGLWTPLAGGLVSLAELYAALSLYPSSHESTWIHGFLALLSVSVAMLGPGAHSIDARLFGRKRLDIDRNKSRKPPP
jgi:putative oxidoreductase